MEALIPPKNKTKPQAEQRINYNTPFELEDGAEESCQKDEGKAFHSGEQERYAN